MSLVVEKRPLLSRKWAEQLFYGAAVLALVVALMVLVTLLLDIFIDGSSRLGWDFLTGYPSRFPEKAGVLPALTGSFCLILLTALFAFPIGIAAAIYLEEYAPQNRLTRIIELNIANLAGVPSIIYGLLGLQLFIRFFGFGRSLLAGAMTMALLILPVIIITARESLRTVPPFIAGSIDCPWSHQVADHSSSCGACGISRDTHRMHPGNFKGDWGNRATDYYRGADLRGIPA